jgi:hypothetical protein
MEMTPLGEGGVKIADVATLLEKILHLLIEDPDEHLPPALEQFFTHLHVFSAHDVEEEIKESKNPGPLKSVLLHKKLGYIFEFAKYGTLDTEMTMNHIVHAIEEAMPSRMPKLVLQKVRRLSRRWDWIRKLSLPLRSSLAMTRIFMHSRIQQ